MNLARTIPAGTLSYAGDLMPAEAWAALMAQPAAQLVDVRTAPEWVFAGLPDLSSLGKVVHRISWKLYPAYDLNPQFLTQLQAAVPDGATPLYFLCKTGGRSLDAAVAATQAGYKACYNIAGGMEGEMNDQRQRGQLTGWKASKLPWEQA
jgi:rhodanese-related sulfurtransferase